MSRSTLRLHEGLLVSGPNDGGLAYMRDYSVLPVLGHSATGIAIDETCIAWCQQIEGVSNSIALLENGRLTNIQLSDSDLDLHDLLPDADGWCVAATSKNAVLRLDRNGSITGSWEFGGEPDAMHLNSLCLHEGRLLASAFGRFTKHRGYKGFTRKAGIVLDVESGETILEGLSQPHSLTSAPNGLYYCDSELNDVVFKRSDGKENRATLPGYTRGLCLGERHLYVGLSCTRNPSSAEIIDRFETAVVAVLNLENMDVIGYVPLPWQEIYDIRLVRDPSFIHTLAAIALDRRDSRLFSVENVRTRAERAEALSRWSIQAWGQATEQRQTIEALTSAVLSLQERLVSAIGGELRRMQEQQAQTVRDAERQIAGLERERQRANEAAARDIDRLKQEYERATQAATRDIKTMQDALAAAMASAEQAQQHSADLQSALESVQAAHVDKTHLLAEREAFIATLQSTLATLRAEREEVVGQLQLDLASLRIEREETVRRLQSDLAALRGEIAMLRPQAATLDLVLHSASWRVTRPLRFMRRLLRHGLGPDDRARLRSRLRNATRRVPIPSSLRHRLARGPVDQLSGAQPLDALPTDVDLASCTQMLAPQPEGLADVFVWSVIDWHFRTQRPQHLARAMSENGHRVFYLSNNLVDTPEPGYSLEALDAEGRLFQVHLNVAGVASIYSSMPTVAQAAQLRASLAELLGWTGTRKSLSLVQHPFWTLPAQCLPNAHLVYDCMDHHAGFDNNSPSILAAEADLIEQADLVIATSDWLRDELAVRTEKVALIRNATDHAHFMIAPEKIFADEQGRHVIGYYGAIAEWFDVDLIRRVAQDHPEALVLLVGSDTVDAAGRLAGLPNVRFTGEVPYRDLPYWLYGFDVCLLPFKVLPLTQATNPVKVYEYLSAARRVVAVDLPEMAQFKGLVEVAADYDTFSDAVTRALASPQDQNERAARRAFAAQQTWAARADALDRSIAAIVEPRVSVVVLTYNNIALTQACLRSLELHSDYPALEIIVVDNASVDGTREFLAQWRDAAPGRKLILNEENRGFAAGNNQGLEIATGDVLVMLNNDTYVTPGWVRTLLWQLRRDDAAGMVGPVTNNIGNEARIEIHYDDMEQMLRESSRYTLAHAGLAMDVKLVAFFCVMLRRSVYERVGGLDEAFGMGFFEDDDYCRRVVESGWKIICAEDVFVHHHLSASFGAMKSEQRKALFDRNRAIYEAKWGAWEPHVYRPGRDG